MPLFTEYMAEKLLTSAIHRCRSLGDGLLRWCKTDLLRMWSAHPSDDTAIAMYAARRTSGSLLCNAEFTCRICAQANNETPVNHKIVSRSLTYLMWRRFACSFCTSTSENNYWIHLQFSWSCVQWNIYHAKNVWLFSRLDCVDWVKVLRPTWHSTAHSSETSA